MTKHQPKRHKLIEWMKKAGSDISKVQIEYYSDDHRGLHAAQDIWKGKTIMFVPDTLMLTIDIISDNPIAKQMIEKSLVGDNSLFCVFLMLEQLKKPGESRFGPYLDMLPQQFN